MRAMNDRERAVFALNSVRDHMRKLRIAAKSPRDRAILDLGEYVYVLRFAPDLVKVGRTGRPIGRVQNLRSSARGFGYALADAWVSPPHGHSRANEDLLIDLGVRRGEVYGGNEYFLRLDYGEICTFAETLRYDPPPPLAIEERIALNFAEQARLRENAEARMRLLMQHRR